MIRLILLLSLTIIVSACKSDDYKKKQFSPDSVSTEQVKDRMESRQSTVLEEAVIISWQDLKDVEFNEKFYEKEKEWMLFPTFGHSVQTLAGKTVEITGYVIPLEPTRYALSANPFSACFFCGNAGPESVIELELASYDQMYYTDEFRTFRGEFSLNTTNLDKMNYVLTGAKPVD
ncbi:MAG: DUF3299 domain-containing protein [Bacteroidia bacterium]